MQHRKYISMYINRVALEDKTVADCFNVQSARVVQRPVVLTSPGGTSLVGEEDFLLGSEGGSQLRDVGGNTGSEARE